METLLMEQSQRSLDRRTLAAFTAALSAVGEDR
jgi:hypothetical protein